MYPSRAYHVPQLSVSGPSYEDSLLLEAACIQLKDYTLSHGPLVAVDWALQGH